ncbi:SDR family oxidoreductase [Hoeflea sp. G2-23]|uniref:SDR family oxidoreductase n=1 Tax=Hoeflea algicola TaxID=2983763 RepID=A0ABT3Z469_9HYPH|nr:SDR family NAD(P)-dependent oxidoreductase [Hoeflea algicola]MCY0146565.1 SDR family oxidoreductase [Hoeflea algicola]
MKQGSTRIPSVLITGGAKRIGAELARRFAKEGFKVAIHYNSSCEEAAALGAKLNATAKICTILKADLRSRDGIGDLFNKARDAVGEIDVCINNAAMFVNDDVFDIDDKQFDDHLSVNVKAPVYLSALVAAQPEKADDRLVINLLDNKVFAINPDFFTYTLSKSALLTATHMMAMRFDGFPRVCGIAPSITLISGKQSEENFDKSSRLNPLHRRILPSDIADAAIFIWKTKTYNNQIITIDGGQTMWKLPRDVAFLTEKA